MLAFSIDYYGIFFGATQFVELFCTYATGLVSPVTALYLIYKFADSNSYIFNTPYLRTLGLNNYRIYFCQVIF